ncbi:hypothetical protein OBBRIDRAFT_319919 [Obba rivulosa]|uniref:Uncharacterized protein n=1 Tax=Obba rivulosa TaxID=1052685 RepID=A0A8E2DK22_9APHY|nr:hypothetical protein OBBRIDRAFT_319919 [Obba rivulosa]
MPPVPTSRFNGMQMFYTTNNDVLFYLGTASCLLRFGHPLCFREAGLGLVSGRARRCFRYSFADHAFDPYSLYEGSGIEYPRDICTLDHS